jgi:hypothetical protein
MISLYKFTQGQWEIAHSFVSPHQTAYEEFGSAITIGVSGSKYYMAVSAIGSLCDPSIGAKTGKGRVYLYTYNGTEWSHLENTSYKGEYNKDAIYYTGDIVWQAAQDPIAEGVRGNLLANWNEIGN